MDFNLKYINFKKKSAPPNITKYKVIQKESI